MKHWMAIMCASAALAGQQAARAQEVTGFGNFSHIVANLDKSLEFYRDVLGLEVVTPPQPFDGNPAIMKLGDTPGAQSRMTQLRLPGAPAGSIGVEIIEYKDIDRRPAHPRFQDPGAGNLVLRTPNFDAVVDRAKKAGAHVLTLGGNPVTIGNSRSLFLQDADGFIIELSESQMPGTAFESVVNDAGQIGEAYRAFGLQPTVPGAYNGDKTMTDNAGTPGAQFRESRAPIPSGGAINFLEFKNIDRKPLHTRTQDPGTAILQLNVRGVEAMLPKLKAAGFAVVSTGGVPVDFGGGKIALVRDPNNLFLELIERPPR